MKMKILHINSYYSVSPFYKNLFEEQIKQNLDVTVYVPVAKNYISESVNFGEYTNVSKNHRRFDRYIFHLKHLKILKDVKKQYNISKFDLLHAHSLFSNGYIAYKLSRKYGLPYIVAVRDTDLNVFFKKLPYLRKLGIDILKFAKKVVFLSSTYKEATITKYIPLKLQKIINEKSVIIPNGIDKFWLNNIAENNKNISNKNVNLIFAGVISKRKNTSTTIRACQELIKKGYNVKFTVVGSVENNEEYEFIMKHDFVHYIKEQPKEKLIKLYRDSDIFVMPSVTETFGLVYAEALSQGLPVIYSRGQGFDGQFSEGLVGYHVDCFNEKEIADKIIKIIPQYSIMSNNCIRSSEVFDWIDICKKYIYLYSS